MSPMIKLDTQKDTDFILTTECEDAFNKLNSYLIFIYKVLTLPDFSKPFQIHKFFWYKMFNDIEKYCQECVICQKTKITNKLNKTQLQTIFATRPAEIITSDIMGPLPISNG